MTTNTATKTIYLYELEARFEDYLNEKYSEYHLPHIVGTQTISLKPYNILKNTDSTVYDNALYEYALYLKEEEAIEVLGYNDNE